MAWTVILNALEDDCFFIVSASDPKASVGQTGLMAVFNVDCASYIHAEWSAQDDAQTQNAAVTAMLSEGNSANFVTFTLGTTLAKGQTSCGSAGEHGSQINVSIRNPGEMIGPAAVFSRNQKYPCDVVSLEPATIMSNCNLYATAAVGDALLQQYRAEGCLLSSHSSTSIWSKLGQNT